MRLFDVGMWIEADVGKDDRGCFIYCLFEMSIGNMTRSVIGRCSNATFVTRVRCCYKGHSLFTWCSQIGGEEANLFDKCYSLIYSLQHFAL